MHVAAPCTCVTLSVIGRVTRPFLCCNPKPQAPTPLEPPVQPPDTCISPQPLPSAQANMAVARASTLLLLLVALLGVWVHSAHGECGLSCRMDVACGGATANGTCLNCRNRCVCGSWGYSRFGNAGGSAARLWCFDTVCACVQRLGANGSSIAPTRSRHPRSLQLTHQLIGAVAGLCVLFAGAATLTTQAGQVGWWLTHCCTCWPHSQPPVAPCMHRPGTQ